MNKFKYPIFPNRTYTLEYAEGYRLEVTGQEILDTFYRQAYLDNFLLKNDNYPQIFDSFPQSYSQINITDDNGYQ